jgi:two-component system, NtrC family, nitrogen regulation response regulator GlnG
MTMMNHTAIRTLEDEIACAIQFDGRVMISGERGTRKKFVAHLIHQRSRRRTAPFVIASRRDFGESVSQAQNGTLLIDGIDQLTVPMQRQLQQFLETGMTHGTPRLMTTTGPDMIERVRSGTFGSDLFYRLNIVRLLIPALRDHAEDIPILLKHYLSSYAKTNIPRLSPAASQRLVEYGWPGNIQELKAVAETLAVKDLRRPLEVDDLPCEIDQAAALFPFLLDQRSLVSR